METRAYIQSVEPLSPADDAGFSEGCCITAVDGNPVRDIIDWRWHTSEDQIVVSYIDCDGDRGDVCLEREPGESWGFEFTDVVFDRIIQCRNACIFCFMRQLPEQARASLSLRDDDYRLSFLQGNFVTFTNIMPEDEQRIIEQRISPLRYSLHCITPELRRQVIGKHAAHGVAVAERLLDAGIELHAQIVLMPDVNDGEELRRTIEWCYGKPGIISVGIVPLGYTKHQKRFSKSFNDPAAACAVIECIKPFQHRAMLERCDAWVHASDEFYRNAYGDTLLEELPPAAFYGDFSLFEDGIGIVRTFVDDWMGNPQAIMECARVLERNDARVILVYGCAMVEALVPLLESSPLKGRIIPLFVKNEYFGGNVDVTGLLCAADMAPAIRQEAKRLEQAGTPASFAVIPEVVFNHNHVTLDDMTLSQLQGEAGLELHVVSCDASEYLMQVRNLLDT